MKAEDIGLEKNRLVLGKHSGRHAFKERLEELGFDLSPEDLNRAFERFKVLADKKKEIFDDDIRMLIANEITNIPQTFELVGLQIADCSAGVPSAAVTIRHDGKEITDAGIGDGTIDAIFKTIDRISGHTGLLKDYRVEAVSQGKDALAKVVVNVQFNKSKSAVIGHGLSIDTMLASAKAYIGALNSYLSMLPSDCQIDSCEGV